MSFVVIDVKQPSVGIAMFRRKWYALIVALAILLVGPSAATAQGTATAVITNVDAAHFPEVRVTFRAVDANNQAIGNLTDSDFSFYENNAPVGHYGLTQHDDGPITLIYAIDLGRYANYSSFGIESIRAALVYPFSNGIFRDGVDTVEVLARVNTSGSSDETVVLLSATQSAAAFMDFVNTASFERSNGPTQGLELVRSAIVRMSELVEPGHAGAAIIFLTPFIDTPPNSQAVPEAERIAEEARAAYISIYTLHTHLRGELPDPLRTLAEGSGGQYLLLQRNTDQSADLSRIYDGLTAQRLYYSAAYRSKSGASGPREVGVALQGPVTDRATYEVSLLPPEVAISAPLNGASLEITAEKGSEGEEVLSPATLLVVAETTAWPDGYPRNIVSAELLVNGQVAAHADYETPATRFDFTWEIGGLAEEGPTSVSFQVRVTDELGLTAESAPVMVTLTVVRPQVQGFIAGCLANPLRLGCLAALLLIPAVLVGGLIVLGAAVFLIQRSRKKREAAEPAVPALGTIVSPAAGAPVRPSVRLAKLRVLEGPPDQEEREIPLTQEVLRIGRNPDVVDIVFYAEERSTVSGRHCTLQYFQRHFFITDDNSTNGTWVNGERLKPGHPRRLEDGDIIVLGDLALKGVKMEFQAGELPEEAPPVDEEATRVEYDLGDEEIGGQTLLDADETGNF